MKNSKNNVFAINLDDVIKSIDQPKNSYITQGAVVVKNKKSSCIKTVNGFIVLDRHYKPSIVSGKVFKGHLHMTKMGHAYLRKAVKPSREILVLVGISRVHINTVDGCTINKVQGYVILQDYSRVTMVYRGYDISVSYRNGEFSVQAEPQTLRATYSIGDMMAAKNR